MLILCSKEMCYEIQIFKSKLPLFYGFDFLKEHSFVNKATSLTFDIYY